MAKGKLDGILGQLSRLVVSSASTEAEGQLLEEFVRHHSEAAFAELVRRHGPMVLAVCRRVLQNSHAAEDAFQAVFLVLARKASSIRRQQSIASWLCRVAYRVALAARGQSARREDHERQVIVMAGAEAEPELERRETQTLLDEEVQRLPAKLHAPVVLCYLEGKTYEEAARLLCWPLGTVKKRLGQARERLRERLAGRGLAVTAGLIGTLLEPNAPAAVPSVLSNVTVKAALHVVAGGAPAVSGASAPAIVLAERMVKSMFAFKLKLAAAVVLAVATVSMGMGYYLAQPGKDPGAVAAAPPDKQDKPADNEPPLPAKGMDFYGDPLPPGAIQRLGTVRFRHGANVQEIVYSADGRLLASGSADNTIHLWDADAGKEVRRFTMHEPPTDNPGTHWTIALTPDGKTLTCWAFHGTVQQWDVDTGKEINLSKIKLAEHKHLRDASSVCGLSPDGKTIVSLDNCVTICLSDAATGKRIRQWEAGSPEEVRFAQDGDFRFKPALVNGLVFAPDGKTLASFNCAGVRLWDTATGNEIRRLGTSLGPIPKSDPAKVGVGSLAFTPDGRMLATGERDGAIRLWETATGKERGRLEGQEGEASWLAFTAEGKTLASVSTLPNWTLRLWDVSTGKQVGRMPASRWHKRFAFSPDGTTLAEADGSTILLQEAVTGKEMSRPWSHAFQAGNVVLSPNGKMLAREGANDGEIELWDPASGKQLRRLEGLQAPEDVPYPRLFMSFAPDGKTLFSAWNDTLRWRDVATGRELRRMTIETGVATAEFFGATPKGRTGKCHAPPIEAVAVTPDGKTLAFGEAHWGRKLVFLWDTTTGKEIRRIDTGAGRPASTASVHALALSPDSKVVACGWDDRTTVQLWDVATGKKICDLDGLRDAGGTNVRWPFSLLFAPDGKTLATALNDKTIRLWDVATGKEIRQFEGHTREAICLAFAPDGKLLASGSRDGTVRLWDPATGKELSRLDGHKGAVNSVAFAADGQTLASTSSDTTVLLWDVRP